MPLKNSRPFSRRAFLQQAAAVTSFAALGRRLFAADKPKATFGLGYTLYGMKTLSLDDALKTCAEVGYDNVELCLLEGYPTDPKQFSAADRAKLKDSLAARK